MQFRKARLADVRELQELISKSAHALAASDYTQSQIQGALESAWAVDTQLIEDGTYFVAFKDELIGCGGWSWRGTLFGGDAHSDRQPEALDPKTDAARIRAFFVHPDFARIGIGRSLLHLCEAEARNHGFSAAELVATLPGERMYAACGYTSLGPREYPLPTGDTITFVPMSKRLEKHTARAIDLRRMSEADQ